MKKALVLVTFVAVSLVGPAAFAQGVVGTLHDMSATLTNGTQVCVFCHTPHGSNVDAVLQTNAPLWNQDLSATADFGAYSSLTFDATDIANITNITPR